MFDTVVGFVSVIPLEQKDVDGASDLFREKGRI